GLVGRRRNQDLSGIRPLDIARPLVIEEEKDLVAQNRAATCRAKLVLVENSTVGGVKVPGIEVRVAYELESVAVKLIGPGFGDNVDLPSAIVSVFGLGIAEHDPELGDEVEVGDDGRAPLISLHLVGPVYHETVLVVPRPAHNQYTIIDMTVV